MSRTTNDPVCIVAAHGGAPTCGTACDGSGEIKDGAGTVTGCACVTGTNPTAPLAIGRINLAAPTDPARVTFAHLQDGYDRIPV